MDDPFELDDTMFPMSDAPPQGTFAPMAPMSLAQTESQPPQQHSLPAAPPPQAFLPTAEPAGPAPSRLWGGLTIVGAVLSGAVGYRLGGASGAGAGVLYFGAAKNAATLARELKQEPREGAKTAAVMLFGLAGAGYLTYVSYQRSRRA